MVLGSGNFGVPGDPTRRVSLVVKRFKEMNGVGQEDFSKHMRRLGKRGLVHPNLLGVVTYLFKEEEKLLVMDYIVNNSLAHAQCLTLPIHRHYENESYDIFTY
jgi:hypothetical protein